MKVNIDSGVSITILLVILCLLAGLDLWRPYLLNSEDYNFKLYSKAMKGRQLDSPDKFWKIGYRLEDLEDILLSQYSAWQHIRSSLEGIKSTAVQKELTTNALRQDNAVIVKSNDLQVIRKSRIIIHEILTNDSSVYHIHCGDDNGPLLRVGENDFRTDIRDQCQIFGSTPQASLVPGPHNMFEKIPLEEGKK